MNSTYELLPNAKLLLSSLRSVGYTEETAIADIVDNSISAGATKIELNFDWDRKLIIIADNGKGMNSDELLDSMKIGSADPNDVRDEKDLGRFGMGMKTAAFSIAKQLLVVSKQDGVCVNAEWDLDFVSQTECWNVILKNEQEINDYIELNTKNVGFNLWENGTLIVLSNLDRLIDFDNLDKSKKRFYKIIKNIKEHMAMIFHRFIEDEDVEIYINGNRLEAWNPFVREHPSTMEMTSEELFDGKSDVIIEPFILPHKNKFFDEEAYKKAGGAKDWLGHQGFYVYRNRRLIVYGTWFGKFKKEPAFNLTRIKLDMSADSDFEWGIDIKKSKATLPVVIEEAVLDIAYRAIQKSVAVYNSRGVYNRKNTQNNTSLKYVWEQRRNSLGNYMFYLNKKHPMLLKIFQKMDNELQKELRTYLSLIENYSPTMLSGVIGVNNSADKVNDENKEKDLLSVREKIEILKQLQYEKEEISEVLMEAPEYAYLRNEIKDILDKE